MPHAFVPFRIGGTREDILAAGCRCPLLLVTRNKRTIEQICGYVTVHVALPPDVLKWVVAAAKRGGHKDVSLVIQRALARLKEDGTLDFADQVGGRDHA